MNAPATTIQFDPEVHPSAALFPMLPPDELQELADSIAANGLQQPIVMQGDVLIDGRNRLAACRLAGVEPVMVQFEGDADAFIVGANVRRRHMNKSQLAMAVAKIYPEAAKLKRAGSSIGTTELGFSTSLLMQARTVLRWAPEKVDAIEQGAGHLDDAYEVAKLAKMRSELPGKQIKALEKTDPGLAEKVNGKHLTIDEAMEVARARRETERAQRQGLYELLKRVDELAGSFKHAGNQASFAATLRDFPDEFGTEKASAIVRELNAAFAAFLKELTA